MRKVQKNESLFLLALIYAVAACGRGDGRAETEPPTILSEWLSDCTVKERLSLSYRIVFFEHTFEYYSRIHFRDDRESCSLNNEWSQYIYKGSYTARDSAEPGVMEIDFRRETCKREKFSKYDDPTLSQYDCTHEGATGTYFGLYRLDTSGLLISGLDDDTEISPTIERPEDLDGATLFKRP